MNHSPSQSMPPIYRQVRWWILALLFLVTVINFVDRQALAVLGNDITDEFKLSNTDFGTIVSWFRFGMMLGEFPMGFLMDRVGVRVGLAFAVMWWSLGNGLHAISSSIWHFRLFRFWLGTGECGNYSGGNKLVANWFPVRERALAIGIFNSASMVGSFVAAFLIIPVREAYGWRAGFLVPSVLGVVWVIVWWIMYRQPNEHPSITPAELQHITSDSDPAQKEVEPTNWQLLRLPQTWGLMLCRFLGRAGRRILFVLDAEIFPRCARIEHQGQRVFQLRHIRFRRPRQHRWRRCCRTVNCEGLSGQIRASGYTVHRRSPVFIELCGPNAAKCTDGNCGNFAGFTRPHVSVREYVRFDFGCVSELGGRTRNRIDWRSEWGERYAIPPRHRNDRR